MTRLQELAEVGQAVWLDYLRRFCITSGNLGALIDRGLRGVTANPRIIEEAIAGSADYDEALKHLLGEGKSEAGIYEDLVLDDIRHTADLLRPVYEKTGGLDGYVSMDVGPSFSSDTDGTIREAWRLIGKLQRPNVMIKVPATDAGISAMETLIAEGINVNAALIFSLAQYEAVAEAYIRGLEGLLAARGDISSIASVASFPVSPVDTAVDLQLERMGNRELQGTIAIANAKVAYARSREVFGSERWMRLAAHGAWVQRLLWGSTGTKNPTYPDTLYVDSLIGPYTVSALSPPTLQAFLDHGQAALTLQKGLDDARSEMHRLSSLGMDLDAIAQQLQQDAIDALVRSFEDLMASIAAKRDQLTAGWHLASCNLGPSHRRVEKALIELRDDEVMARIWAHDYAIWKPKPGEISNRLGWLHAPETMADHIRCLEDMAHAVREDHYAHALLLGMGGSSLAPEVFRKTFGVRDGYLDLAVLDSTDPAAVLTRAEGLDPQRTLFIVSTKSGTTVETISFFKFFYNWVRDAVGAARAGEHFIAITDPGSPLIELAERYRFRATLLNDPNIGGRYSALSYFGLAPAALIGADLQTLLERAMIMVRNCEACNCPVGGDNTGGRLGAVLGELAEGGKDKLTLLTSAELASFGDWVEQLIAESTGKEGTGILPVVHESVGSPASYGEDRVFVYMKLEGDKSIEPALTELEEAHYPVVRLLLHDPYDLGSHLFLWEMAVAVAGSRLGINPFDQPNVEAAKVRARELTAEYRQRGSLPAEAPCLEADGISIYSPVKAKDPGEALTGFLGQGTVGAYIALQAYLQPTEETTAALQLLRTRIRDRFRLATTVGYGPRYLHSTGQLHKGDAGNGLFIQFTAHDLRDASIPEEAGSSASSITFGVLKAAQALGDRQELLDRGRKVIRFHLGKDIVGGLSRLAHDVG